MRALALRSMSIRGDLLGGGGNSVIKPEDCDSHLRSSRKTATLTFVRVAGARRDERRGEERDT